MNYYSNKFEKSVEGKLKNFLVQDGAEISAQQNAIWRARTSKYSAIFYNTGKFLIQGSDVSEISKKVEEFLGVSSSSSDVCARQNLSQNFKRAYAARAAVHHQNASFHFSFPSYL